MGKWFNDNLKHAKTWPRRGRDDLRREMLERRQRKRPEESLKAGGETTLKHPGGRLPLDIDVARVLDRIGNGKTVTETANLMGISRQAVYRTIRSSQ